MKIGKDLFKKLSHWLKAKFSAYYSNRYYSTLEELPIWNWWKIHETKDLSHLIKGKKKLTNHAPKIFDELHSEFIRIFGVSENYQKYLSKLIEIEIAEIDMVVNENRTQQTFIDIMNIELDEIKSVSEGVSYIDGAIAVEKHMGFKLNSKELSVFEYYSYVKSLEKQVK